MMTHKSNELHALIDSDRLVEKILETRPNEALWKELWPDWEYSDELPNMYIAYIDRPEKYIHAIEGYPLEYFIGFKQELNRFVNFNKTPNYFDIVAFISMYFQCRRLDIDLKVLYEPRYFENNGIVDTILRDSHGYLLWHYQLEHLLRLFYCPNEATEFCKKINKHDPDIWEKAKSLEICQNLSIYDVLERRMLSNGWGITENPEFQGARNLYEYLYSGTIE